MDYASWYEKDLRDVSEHEKCYADAGLECERCKELVRGEEYEKE